MIVGSYMLHGLRIYFRWFDLWIGIFVNRPSEEIVWIVDSLDPDWLVGRRDHWTIYVQPLPMVGVRFEIARDLVRAKRDIVEGFQAIDRIGALHDSLQGLVRRDPSAP